MNIGIDIDGVITNIDFLGILGKKKPILDKESSNLKVNNFLIRKILYKGIAFYSKHSKLRSDAAKYINLLKDDGNRITIITKRRFAGEETKEGKDIRSLVEVFLIEQGIPYDKIVFSKGNKLDDCLREKVTVMLEDSPKNSENISKRIPVILMDTPYNRNVSGDNIYRVTHWEEAYALLSALGKRKVKSYEKN